MTIRRVVLALVLVSAVSFLAGYYVAQPTDTVHAEAKFDALEKDIWDLVKKEKDQWLHQPVGRPEYELQEKNDLHDLQVEVNYLQLRYRKYLSGPVSAEAIEALNELQRTLKARTKNLKSSIGLRY